MLIGVEKRVRSLAQRCCFMHQSGSYMDQCLKVQWVGLEFAARLVLLR